MQEIESILYLAGLFFGGTGAWIISIYSRKLGLLDKPNERSSHAIPTPKGGGIGILAAFVLASLFLEIPLAFWLPAALLSLFSFLGDKVEIPAKLRLLAQFIVAFSLLCPVFFTNSSITLCLLTTDYYPLTTAFCLFPLSVFVVGTANYYNFMDGINGIAGITGVVAFGLLAFFAYLSRVNTSFMVLAICMSLSCLGFLPFNMPKAKVFMGDVGSIFLGFAFAGMVIWLSKSFLDFICLAAFLFPFYADELTTLVVRIKEGDKLMKPHRKHLYQLLANEKGMPHWKVSVGYGILQLVVGASVFFLKDFGIVMILCFLGLCFLGFLVVSRRIRLELEVA